MQRLKKSFIVGSVTAVVACSGLTGCATWHAREAQASGRTVAQVADDHRITEKVSDALEKARVYKFPMVGVKTYDGTVQLNGFAETDGQKQTAGKIAQSIAGVKGVVNDITVQPVPPAGATGELSQVSQSGRPH